VRTEKEIRALRDALEKLRKKPCDCTSEHVFGCIVGGRMMQAAATNLTWALGESDEMNAMVEQLLKDAAEYKPNGC
jgi:hypothetical protein